MIYQCYVFWPRCPKCQRHLVVIPKQIELLEDLFIAKTQFCPYCQPLWKNWIHIRPLFGPSG